ncbi:MAG: hypothetical protein LWY06_01270 [Firmicutes bacterium]|nr:hypothetical protein [Bacillota bacterium]
MSKQCEMAGYIKQLAFLTGRGVSFRDALINTYRDLHCGDTKKKISGAVASERFKDDYTDSLKGVFPKHILTLIKKGEEENKLSAVLYETASAMAAEEEKRQIADKMTGLPLLPFFVFVTGIIYVLYIQYSFLDNYFEGMDLELPQITQLYTALCSFIERNPIILLVSGALAVMQFLFQLSDKTKNRFIYRIPVLNKSILKFYEHRAFIWITLMEKTGIGRNHAYGLLAEGTDFTPEREKLQKMADSPENYAAEPAWGNPERILQKRQGAVLNVFALFYALTEAFVIFAALVSFFIPLYGGCIHCYMSGILR